MKKLILILALFPAWSFAQSNRADSLDMYASCSIKLMCDQFDFIWIEDFECSIRLYPRHEWKQYMVKMRDWLNKSKRRERDKPIINPVYTFVNQLRTNCK